jgi:hypothetical protein
LRTTIKVFLRTEEKKREASRPKEATPATPVQADHTPQLAASTSEAPVEEAGDSDAAHKVEASAPQDAQQQNADGGVSANEHIASTELVCPFYPGDKSTKL